MPSKIQAEQGEDQARLGQSLKHHPFQLPFFLFSQLILSYTVERVSGKMKILQIHQHFPNLQREQYYIIKGEGILNRHGPLVLSNPNFHNIQEPSVW